MGDLKDQFKKAGLLNKKDVKRLQHEERVRRKKEGRDAADKDVERSRAEFEKKRAAKAEDDRRREQQRNQERKARERLDRLKSLVDNQAVRDRDRGRGCKFFFETRTGMVPFLDMSLDQARLVVAGNLAIIDLPWEKIETFALVPRGLAQEVFEFDREALRFLAG